MASINNLLATTELEAVNAMLSAIGEAPIDDVDAATQVDVESAIAILRATSREVQTYGWRFNTEFGLAVEPAATNYNWNDPDGTVVPLTIFTPPTGLIGFTISPTNKQVNSTYAEIWNLVVRKSKQWTDPDTDASALVFYDRSRNRDGFPDSENVEFLYIDPVWLFDFEDMPETARRYITVLATRRFAQNVLGDREIVGYTLNDQYMALRNLKKDQGKKDNISLLDHPDTARMLGNRPGRGGLFVTRRNRPL